MPDHDRHTPATDAPAPNQRRRRWIAVVAALVLVAGAGVLAGSKVLNTPPASGTDAILSIQQSAGGGLASHSCTATVITPDRALTAAHCVTPVPNQQKELRAARDQELCSSVDLDDRPKDPRPPEYAPTVVRSGTTNYQRGGEISAIASVHALPGWDWGEDDDPVLDLAVIELDPPMTVPPASMGTYQPKVGSHLHTAGWATRPDRCGGIDPAMQQWDVTVVSCAPGTDPEIICVSTGGATGPCEGISSGPLYATDDDGMTVIVAVYSRSAPQVYCGQTMAMYTLIAAHQKWIADTIYR